jgi:pyruvate dehydrogenase E1 component alpha subunit
MLSDNILIKIYKKFHLIRASQEKLIKQYHPEDMMRCPIHFCLGQESLASVSSLFLTENDYVLSHHRSHGYYLAKECPLDAMVAEFYGKNTGANSGLAGSQELSFHKKRFYSGTILSGMFSIALGTAYKNKLLKKGISVTIIGDGGMEEGIVYETMNIASLMSLPVLFICENNNFSVHTNIKNRTKIRNFKKLSNNFGIRYSVSKSHKIENIYNFFKNAYKYVSDERKPMFIEHFTMRECGHVGPENDDFEYGYREKELKSWKAKNANNYFLSLLKKRKISIDFINRIQKKNYQKIVSAIKNAKNSKFLTYNNFIQANYKKDYHKIIKSFYKKNYRFDSDQQETKLIPY